MNGTNIGIIEAEFDEESQRVIRLDVNAELDSTVTINGIIYNSIPSDEPQPLPPEDKP